MARRLFTLSSALSLLLCAAVCVLWVRSYDTTDRWSWLYGVEAGTAMLTRGQISLLWLHGSLDGTGKGDSHH